MSGSIKEKLENLAALDSAGLGELVRAKTLQAVAMHFMLRGVAERLAQIRNESAGAGTYWRVRDGKLYRADEEGDTL